jgi:NADH:ubiquinone oxidoreductase subunit 5 (subunit L)/multisubunit Na+/H+ antiporter MnhA subunit
MFARFYLLSLGLVLGFNLVAVAPTLAAALGGWSLFGFSSAFLIGSYNDRPTARNNATFAFAAYRVADFALLGAATFSAAALAATGDPSSPAAAGCLLLAALFKASQFPLSSLFMRSMEGPTPTSALGYAGLSAHVGVVLLASTMPVWFPFVAVRAALAGIGLYTALASAAVARTRADRKGALACVASVFLRLRAFFFGGSGLFSDFGFGS